MRSLCDVQYNHKAKPTFDDISLVEFTYPVSARMPGGVTVGDSCLFRCVPCLLNVITSLWLLIKHTSVAVKNEGPV